MDKSADFVNVDTGQIISAKTSTPTSGRLDSSSLNPPLKVTKKPLNKLSQFYCCTFCCKRTSLANLSKVFGPEEEFHFLCSLLDISSLNIKGHFGGLFACPKCTQRYIDFVGKFETFKKIKKGLLNVVTWYRNRILICAEGCRFGEHQPPNKQFPGSNNNNHTYLDNLKDNCIAFRKAVTVTAVGAVNDIPAPQINQDFPVSCPDININHPSLSAGKVSPKSIVTSKKPAKSTKSPPPPSQVSQVQEVPFPPKGSVVHPPIVIRLSGPPPVTFGVNVSQGQGQGQPCQATPFDLQIVDIIQACLDLVNNDQTALPLQILQIPPASPQQQLKRKGDGDQINKVKVFKLNPEQEDEIFLEFDEDTLPPSPNEDDGPSADPSKSKMELQAADKELTPEEFIKVAPYFCEICGPSQRYMRKGPLIKHYNKEHQESEKSHPCPHPNCGELFVSKVMVDQHRVTKHGEKYLKYGTCEYCPDLKFKCFSSLFRHSIQIHERKADEEDKIHECHRCNKRFMCHYLYQRHLSIHNKYNGNRPIVCDICDARFRETSHLDQHMKTTHSGFKCRACAAPFCNRQFLFRHEATVHPELKVHECQKEGCGQKFILKELLTTHEKTHGDQEPYMCDLCKVSRIAYKSEKALTHHINQHMGVTLKQEQTWVNVLGSKKVVKKNTEVTTEPEPVVDGDGEGDEFVGILICPKCGRKYWVKKFYDEHCLKCEESGGPPTCDICGRAFDRLWKLTSHKKNKHSMDKNKNKERRMCDVCGKLVLSTYLNSHMKYHSDTYSHPRKDQSLSTARTAIPKLKRATRSKNSGNDNQFIQSSESLVPLKMTPQVK